MKKLLFFIFLPILLFAQVEPQTPTTFNNLVHLWRFESGGNQSDLKGNLTLTQSGSLPTRTVEGRTCVVTDGANIYTATHQSSIDFTNNVDWSIHFRMGCDNAANYNTLWQKWTTGPTIGYRLAIDMRAANRGSQRQVNSFDGVAFIYMSYGTFPYATMQDTTQLNSLAFVYDAPDSFYVYFNGAQVDTAMNVSGMIDFKNSGDATILDVVGGVAYEIAVFNKALTAAEITQLYTGNYPSTATNENSYNKWDGYNNFRK